MVAELALPLGLGNPVARRDLEALVGGHEPITLDEVQREPGLLSAVKRAIDRNRSAGRFLLTGSANLLLMRQVSESLAVARAELGYWRTTIGEEVDFVIEAGGKLLPIEVKASPSPRLADCAHLRSFRAEYGNKARAGLLLHTGSSIEWLSPDVLAAPWWRVIWRSRPMVAFLFSQPFALCAWAPGSQAPGFPLA